MTCPVEMTDYESALIGADWYEEFGMQEIADQIRLRSRSDVNGWSRYGLRRWAGFKSRSGSRSGSKFWSESRSRSWPWSWSRSLSRARSVPISTNTSRTGRRIIQ